MTFCNRKKTYITTFYSPTIPDEGSTADLVLRFDATKTHLNQARARKWMRRLILVLGSLGQPYFIVVEHRV